MCFNLIKEKIVELLYTPKEEISKPKNVVASYSWALEQTINQKYPNCIIRLLDWNYKTTTLGEYARFVDYDAVNFNQYIAEYMDCDNFAISLWGAMKRSKNWGGLAFGYVEVVISEGVHHAINCFITNDGSFYFLEPQNDSYWLAGTKGWTPYFIMI